MTKVLSKRIKCAKCGVESEQMIVYSVNYLLGDKESNDKLVEHKQICPNCNFTAPDISVAPAPLHERWANEDLGFHILTPEEVACFIKAPDSKIYKPFGIDVSEIDKISEKILLMAVKKHQNGNISEEEIEKTKNYLQLLLNQVETIKSEPYIKRLIWENSIEVDYIRGISTELSPRLKAKVK